MLSEIRDELHSVISERGNHREGSINFKDIRVTKSTTFENVYYIQGPTVALEGLVNYASSYKTQQLDQAISNLPLDYERDLKKIRKYGRIVVFKNEFDLSEVSADSSVDLYEMR